MTFLYFSMLCFYFNKFDHSDKCLTKILKQFVKNKILLGNLEIKVCFNCLNNPMHSFPFFSEIILHKKEIMVEIIYD